MKMVKSLLLGSAAGLVAMSGAQAADLPVKAKKVEYVKICPLYGKGFYYLPGSNDMCLSITGFVRFQIYANQGGVGTPPSGVAGGTAWGYGTYSNTSTPFQGDNGFDVRAGRQSDLTTRVRTMVTFDSRAQTAYGTLRAVTTTGFNSDVVGGGSAGTGIYANRAFIQLAGFTLGKATSFFDHYTAPAYSYLAIPNPDTGDGGAVVMAYTAQFGGGVAASVSLEEPRRASIINTVTGTGNLVTAATGYNTYVQYLFPDVVGALRWDQAWGSFQVSGALHDASGGYYGANAVNQIQNGHPSDKWGWALGVGGRLRLGADILDVMFTYSEGAMRYPVGTAVSGGGAQLTSSGAPAGGQGSVGYGIQTDGVYGASPGAVELTTAWNINAAYDHRWSPTLKTSVYGNYLAVSFNSTATALLCAASAANNGLSAATAAVGVCNQDWEQFAIGSRTQWDVARGFYVGVDALYTKLQTANKGGTTAAGFSPGLPRTNGVYAISDQDTWVFTFRAHRDIVP